MRIQIFLIPMLVVALNGQVTTQLPYSNPEQAATMGASIALSRHASTSLINPASLTQQEGRSLLIATQNLYGQKFLGHQTAVLNTPVSDFGTVSLSAQSMGVNYEGNALSTENTLGLSHAFKLRSDRLSELSIGYTLKHMRVEYGRSAGQSGDGSDGLELGSSSALGIDIGIQTNLSKRHWMGVVVHNVNRPQIGSGGAVTALPRDIQAGFTYAPTREVLTHFSIVNKLVADPEFHAGMEYVLNPYLTLRSGIQSSPNRFGTGFSFKAKGFSLDYALVNHPVLPVTHLFSLAYDLPMKGNK